MTLLFQPLTFISLHDQLITHKCRTLYMFTITLRTKTRPSRRQDISSHPCPSNTWPLPSFHQSFLGFPLLQCQRAPPIRRRLALISSRTGCGWHCGPTDGLVRSSRSAHVVHLHRKHASFAVHYVVCILVHAPVTDLVPHYSSYVCSKRGDGNVEGNLSWVE